MHMIYPIILCALLLVVLCNLFKERKRAVNVYQMCFKLDKTVSEFIWLCCHWQNAVDP